MMRSSARRRADLEGEPEVEVDEGQAEEEAPARIYLPGKSASERRWGEPPERGSVVEARSAEEAEALAVQWDDSRWRSDPSGLI